jgi:hypothetical protein
MRVLHRGWMMLSIALIQLERAPLQSGLGDIFKFQRNPNDRGNYGISEGRTREQNDFYSSAAG